MNQPIIGQLDKLLRQYNGRVDLDGVNNAQDLIRVLKEKVRVSSSIRLADTAHHIRLARQGHYNDGSGDM